MAPKSKAPQADHRVGITREENALMCWLRLHPAVAKTFGIEKCHGKTTIGSMLSQTLEAQGMDLASITQAANAATGVLFGDGARST